MVVTKTYVTQKSIYFHVHEYEHFVSYSLWIWYFWRIYCAQYSTWWKWWVFLNLNKKIQMSDSVLSTKYENMHKSKFLCKLKFVHLKHKRLLLISNVLVVVFVTINELVGFIQWSEWFGIIWEITLMRYIPPNIGVISDT